MQQLSTLFGRNVSIWRVLIFTALMFFLIVSLTSMQAPSQTSTLIFAGGRSVERETLSTDGFLQNSKFVVTKGSKSYDVNPNPKCWTRHCSETNNKLAFSSCDKIDSASTTNFTSNSLISPATEWNALGVRTMERYVSGNGNNIEGLSNQLLWDAFYQFSNASASSDHKCFSAALNLAIVSTKLRKYQLAAEYYQKAEGLASGDNERAAIVHVHWGLNQELSGLSGNSEARLSTMEHYDKVRSLDPQVEKDYWGVATTSVGRRELSAYGPELAPHALLDFLLYKHFSHISIDRYSLLSPGTQDFFIENRYTILRHILPPFCLQAAQKFYRDLIASGSLKFGDGQSYRYVTYNDRVARFIHYQIADLIRRVIAHNAIPSYTYFGGYKEGSALLPHTDRQACEFTLSFNVQQFPFDKPWTLSAGTKALFDKDPKWSGRNPERIPDEKETVNADLYSGDGLLFMGRHLIHFRRGKLPEGHWTNQIFLHFVQEDFTGELA